MNRHPTILDLYAGVGGASVGYARAGFHVIGLDINPQPDYPFEDFVQQDALNWMRFLLAGMRHGVEWKIDAIHASPPCQAYAAITKGTNAARTEEGKYPRLYEETKDLLDQTGLPYVIENPAARPDIVLCGEMFGLGVIRHRRFELGGWSMGKPIHKEHRGRVAGYRHGQWYDGPYFAVYGNGGGKGTVKQWQQAMGIDWTTRRKSIAEALPPAYTEFIGRALRVEVLQRDALRTQDSERAGGGWDESRDHRQP